MRITILLLILAFVAADSWLAKIRSTDWNDPIWVVVYPINGDGSAASRDYIAGLQQSVFLPVEKYMAEEAARYGLAISRPVEIKLGPTINESPPLPPAQDQQFDIMLWSLKLRYWSAMNNDYDGPVDLKLYVRYFDPAAHARLPHSVGLQKGLVGIVNAFADNRYTGQNNVVITHEMLHLFGATDKYNMATNLPDYPHGFAEPDRFPLYPQQWAEIMGGRIPVSENRADIPDTLNRTLIGALTAEEINWLEEE